MICTRTGALLIIDQNQKVIAVEMSYLRGSCDVTRWEGESNESVYERCGMGLYANRVKCGVVEWVKEIL